VRIRLRAVGTRLPAWVQSGFAEYAKRLPHQCALQLEEIALAPRGKGAEPHKAKASECQRLLAGTTEQHLLIAVDERGQLWSTQKLAEHLQAWLQDGCEPILLVGGPDGLTDVCRARATHIWSLSALTLPHGLVRIILAEQVYRAWSILQHHPYHRAGY